LTIEAGISNGLIGKARKRGSLSQENISKILYTYRDLNANWLFTGNGEMIKSFNEVEGWVMDENFKRTRVNENYNKEFKHLLKSETKDSNDLPVAKLIVNPSDGIPLIPIEAMAGYGRGEMQIMEFESERFVVPTFSGADFLIQVKGSSMYPKYNSGDIVACKKLLLNDLFFQWNKVYVLDTEQGALIKRIGEGKDEDHINIISDNEKYAPFNLSKHKINAISIVMGVIRLE
jgi:repressor LexA